MRNLVTIQTVSKIQNIEGADFIALASMENLGWKCIVKKSDVNVGDKVVYIEIDSLVPVNETFDFLKRTASKKINPDGFEGYFIRTMKMKGVLSQGLMLPISLFPQLASITLEEGMDVTELVGIQQYEAPIPLCIRGEVKGNFPSNCSRSDQCRIHQLLNYFIDYKDMEFEVSIKLDGTSASYIFDKGEYKVCSRNLQLKEDEKNTYWRLSRQYHINEILSKYGRNIMLQGEIIGESIQKNPEKLKGQDFFIYNIFDIDKAEYVDFEERTKILNELNEIGKEFDVTLKQVPIIGVQKIFQICPDLESILNYAEGGSLNPSTNREGIVCKSRRTENGIIQFKVISNSYLLKLKE